jgi:large subunit ribosomal protein L33
MAKKENVLIVALACSQCGHHNYYTPKNRQKTRQKLAFRKHCKWCRKHTEHKEV